MDRENVFDIHNGTLYTYSGAEKRVAVPDGITRIGCEVFSNNQTVEAVALPEGLVEIGNDAFSGCKNLKSVSFPSTLKKIDRYAFRDCVSLESVSLPPSVKPKTYRASSSAATALPMRTVLSSSITSFSTVTRAALP